VVLVVFVGAWGEFAGSLLIRGMSRAIVAETSGFALIDIMRNEVELVDGRLQPATFLSSFLDIFLLVGPSVLFFGVLYWQWRNLVVPWWWRLLVFLLGGSVFYLLLGFTGLMVECSYGNCI
jgi:hypothetical protein